MNGKECCTLGGGNSDGDGEGPRTEIKLDGVVAACVLPRLIPRTQKKREEWCRDSNSNSRLGFIDARCGR